MDTMLSCAHGPVSMLFDFTAVDEAIGAVQANISLSCLTNLEKVEWGIHEVWIPYRALAQFEAALCTDEPALLTSTRGDVFVRVVEDAGAARLEVGRLRGSGAPDAEGTRVRVMTEPGLKRALERAFLDYAKWW